MRMQSELHRDLWAVTGRGHAGFLGRACPDSPQPSLPMTAASLLPLLPPPSPPLDQVLFSSLEFLFLFLLVRTFWMSFLLDSPICILSGWGENSRGHWVERAGAGSFMKSARVRMCLAVLASGSFSVEGKWVGCACVPGSCDGRGVNKGFGAGSHSVHSLSLHCQPLGQAHSALVVTVQFRMR